MAAPKRDFPNRATVRLYRTVTRVREDGESHTQQDAGTKVVRYRIEQAPLGRLVQKAAGNKSGRATSGLTTIVIHPEDRSK